ncbi:hypothetical protein [Methermicoccus shengliensis]|uniref:Uncharacterized protein n=1 Tax=Methermicoccus shengliensis TaxID=660064 RepID=A0A832VZC4_9EURY|nr:hypothetical protein [Methermicoccus shengliensis]KUK05039.1 MAG: hypothetical protein XD46_0032 [Euryarchaeota archaeon 55_53]KUK30249.1 MAG: hypothetical protein XD62_0688 [Methanosarcinales archeaon 56_1174]MDI3487577.1 hypothetical protein [Methanosarcinales archaeon]MDN5294726.1 hypothetical protein [Methanosarcinales archaeon]HIH69439.1 hypothetical protein [Methermicoccus shengliensis]
MNTRLASYFMVAIMVISTLWVIGIGLLDSSKGPVDTQPTPTEEGTFNVPGRLVYASFDSLEHCLNITPSGVVRAVFLDPSRAEGTPLGTYLSTQLSQLYPYPLYFSNVQRAYIAQYGNGSSLEMHYIRPKTFSFNYLNASTYKRYTVIERINPAGYTVLGDPIVYSPERELVNATIDRLSDHNDTALGQYAELFEVTWDTAQDAMQVVGVAPDGTIYYMGLHPNGTLSERWTFYLEPSESLLDSLTSRVQSGMASGNFTVYTMESTQLEGRDVVVVSIDAVDPELLLTEPLV